MANDRFRFRAWDRHHKMFVDQRKFCIRFDGEIVTLSNSGHWSTQNPADFYVMQFTGLLDKEGREIYEGDVLFWDGSIIGAVSFAHAEFIVGEGRNARALCAAPEEYLEVIGNIYESPELLGNPRDAGMAKEKENG